MPIHQPLFELQYLSAVAAGRWKSIPISSPWNKYELSLRAAIDSIGNLSLERRFCCCVTEACRRLSYYDLEKPHVVPHHPPDELRII